MFTNRVFNHFKNTSSSKQTLNDRIEKFVATIYTREVIAHSGEMKYHVAFIKQITTSIGNEALLIKDNAKVMTDLTEYIC